MDARELTAEFRDLRRQVEKNEELVDNRLRHSSADLGEVKVRLTEIEKRLTELCEKKVPELGTRVAVLEAI